MIKDLKQPTPYDETILTETAPNTETPMMVEEYWKCWKCPECGAMNPPFKSQCDYWHGTTYTGTSGYGGTTDVRFT